MKLNRKFFRFSVVWKLIIKIFFIGTFKLFGKIFFLPLNPLLSPLSIFFSTLVLQKRPETNQKKGGGNIKVMWRNRKQNVFLWCTYVSKSSSTKLKESRTKSGKQSFDLEIQIKNLISYRNFITLHVVKRLLFTHNTHQESF